MVVVFVVPMSGGCDCGDFADMTDSKTGTDVSWLVEAEEFDPLVASVAYP